MSAQGLANAALYCQGSAVHCLAQNYAGGGKTRSLSTMLLSKSDTTAQVELRTTWVELQGQICQTYTVDKTSAGWRITFFAPPSLCAR
jgi:hypothetical protein